MERYYYDKVSYTCELNSQSTKPNQQLYCCENLQSQTNQPYSYVRNTAVTILWSLHSEIQNYLLQSEEGKHPSPLLQRNGLLIILYAALYSNIKILSIP